LIAMKGPKLKVTKNSAVNIICWLAWNSAVGMRGRILTSHYE